MSSSRGLSDYMNTISTLGSNVDNINNYIAQNNNEFFQDWRAKVQNDIAAVKSKADAAFHTAEGIGGAYMGAKAVKAAYMKFKGGKETPEDEGADNEGDAGETDQAEANDFTGEDGTAGDSVDGTPLDDTPNEGAGSSFTEAPSDNLPAPGESVELQDASEFGSGADDAAAPLSETINAPANVGTTAQSQILDADPEAGPGGIGQTLTGDTAGEVGADVGAEVGGDVAAGAGADAAAGAAAAAAGAGADAAAGGLAAGLGVAAEAIPVVGALAAIGFGLYELFHPHHDPPKPKPPPPANSITAAQSSLVLPSFDSVVDTPASAAAF